MNGASNGASYWRSTRGNIPDGNLYVVSVTDVCPSSSLHHIWFSPKSRRSRLEELAMLPGNLVRSLLYRSSVTCTCLGMIYLIQISTVVLNLESHPAYWTVSAPYTTALYKKLRVSENIGGNRILNQASRRSYFGVMRMVHCWESWTRHILTQIQRTFGKTTKLMYLGQEGGRAGVGCC